MSRGHRFATARNEEREGVVVEECFGLIYGRFGVDLVENCRLHL